MYAAIAIAVIIVAVAFAVLVLYLAQTLKATQRTMNNVADTLEGLEKQIEGITTETTLLLQKTNDLAEDVNQKTAKLDSMFEGVEVIGDSFHGITKTISRLTATLTNRPDEDYQKASEAVKWGTAIFSILKKKK